MPFYVVFEGIDGAGKTTQAELTYNHFNNDTYKAFLFHEPAHPMMREIIYRMISKHPQNNYSKEAIALAFALDRYMYKDEVLEKLLSYRDGEVKRNLIIIGDRSFYSSIVYQHVMGLDVEWLKEINKYVVVPDLTIVLEIGIEDFKKRRGESNIVFEREQFQRKLIDEYKKLKEYFPDHNIVYVDGTKSIEEINNYVVNLIKDVWGGKNA